MSTDHDPAPATTGGPSAGTPGSTAGAAPAYLTHREIIQVMIGLMAGMFLAALDQSIVGTALPSIVSDLGGLAHMSWVVTAYLLTSTASTPLWGKISDLYGRRPMFQAAIIIFLVGSLVAGAAQDMTTLILGRAIQGLGGGGLIALALAIVGDVIPAHHSHCGRESHIFVLPRRPPRSRSAALGSTHDSFATSATAPSRRASLTPP